MQDMTFMFEAAKKFEFGILELGDNEERKRPDQDESSIA